MSDDDNPPENTDVYLEEYYQYINDNPDDFSDEFVFPLMRRYLESIIYNNFQNIIDIDSPINLNIYEDVFNESLQTSNSLERTDEYVNFPTIKYDKTNVEKQCVICLIDFEENSEIVITECKHVFHADCIKEWTRYKKDCPVCREELKNKIEKKE